MPRIARIVIPGRAHHMARRGNNRQNLFCVDGDRAAYLGTRTGRPLVGATLLSKLETALGRRLRPLPVGRPPKEGRPRNRKAAEP